MILIQSDCQEVILLIHCVVLRGCCYLHYGLKAPLRNMRKLIGLESIRQGWIERERHPLRDLVRECRYRKATDPRYVYFKALGF